MSKEYTPVVIAKSFTKQYYEIIHKKPQQLYRFYKDESSFFHGESNEVADPISGGDNIREKVEQLNLAGASVDLSEGSIDAQRSDNNAVFLVVTGKFKLPGKPSRPFVQSFLLVCQNSGKNDSQPSYYVRNSVFRLFGQETTPDPTPAAPAMITTSVFEKKETEVVAQEDAAAKSASRQEISTEEDDATKSGAPSNTQSDELDAATINSEPDYVNVSVKSQEALPQNGETSHSEQKPETVPERTKPASWACLFSDSAPQEPVQQQQQQQPPKQQKKVVAKKDSDSEKPNNSKPPLLTLYVSHLPENVTSAELEPLFERFGKIKNIDVHAERGFAFVDYADASAVKKAVQKKGTPYFSLRDTLLQIEERPTKSKGGNNNNRRGASGNNGGNRQNGMNNNRSGNDKGRGDNRGNNNNRNNNRNSGNKPGSSKQAIAK